MQYRVRFVDETSFMKEWGNNPDIKQKVNGREVNTGMKYKNSSIPNTKVLYVPKYSQDDRRMLISMNQDEINDVVKKMTIFDKKGNKIDSAPLETDNHPFWIEHCNYVISNGEATLDDTVALENIIISAMRKDREFYFKAEENTPRIRGVHKWEVVPISEKYSDVVETNKDSMDASKKLFTLDHGRKISILNAMGYRIADNTGPEVVDAMLFQAITINKNDRSVDGHTNIQVFNRLIAGSATDIDFIVLFNNSKQLFTKSGSYYHYGAVRLGRTSDEVVRTLKENIDIAEELRSKQEK